MKKILIIDEKESHSEGSGKVFYENLNSELKKYVDIEVNLSNIIQFNTGEITLHFDPSHYIWVFFHDGYKGKNLPESDLSSFKSQVNNYILFSGGKEDIGFGKRATTRFELFRSLEKALEVLVETNKFPVKYVCDNIYNPYYPIIDELEDYLNEGKRQEFLNSEWLTFILRKLNYTESEVIQILERYTLLDLKELNQKLQDWKRKKI